MKVNKTNRYVLGATMFLGYTLFAASWKIGDLFISQLGFGSGQIGTMTSIITVTKVIVSFLAASFVASLAASKVFRTNIFILTFGMLAVAASVFLMTFNDSFAWLALMRAFTGLGGALLLYALNPIVADIFPDNELPVVNALNSSGFNIGIAVMLALAIAVQSHPQMAMYLVAIVLVALALLGFITGKGLFKQAAEVNSVENKETKPAEKFTFFDGLRTGFNWIFALGFTGIIAMYYTSFTFLDKDVIQHVMLAGIAGNLVGGVLASKVDKLKLIRISGIVLLATALVFVFFRQTTFIPVIAILLGFLIFLPVPAYITLGFKQKGASPAKIAITFTMLWVMSDLISSGVVIIAGFLLEAYTDAIASLFVIGIYLLFPAATFILNKSLFNK